jgi:hypothetical protein
MSTAHELASLMSGMTVPELAHLLRERAVTPVRFPDLYDLAEHLLSPASVQSATDRLSAPDVDALRGGAGHQRGLHLVGLCGGDGQPFPAVIDALPAGADSREIPATLDAETPTGHVLATVVALRDLIELAAHEPIKTGVSGNLLRGERAMLAERLTLEEAHAAVVVELALAAGIIRVLNRTLCATEHGIGLRDDLAGLFTTAVAVTRATVAHSVFAVCAETSRLDDALLDWAFPNPTTAGHAAARQFAERCDALGLRDGGTTPLGRALLSDDTSALADFTTTSFPELVTKVYVLDDLSIIAPGPLTSDVARILDRVAHAEAHGLAPRYRLTIAALNYSYAHGDDADSVRAMLESVSLVPLSATITSFITDAYRHGRFVTLTAGSEGVTVHCSTRELAHAVLNDPRFDGVQRQPASDTAVLCAARIDRFESLLIDAGYHLVEPAPTPVVVPNPVDDITTVEAEQLLVAGLGAGHMERALMLALRTKTRVTISVQMPAGPTDMVVEPRSVANGRLRALDINVDAERTVPISAITNLTTVEG